MAWPDEFADITRAEEPLAPFTLLRVGGPAERLVRPRTRDELAGVVRAAFADGIPFRILGSGSNLVIGDEGVRGVVVRLDAPDLTGVSVDGRHLTACAGAPLSAAISAAARHGLSGLEGLVGLHGTVGGALHSAGGDPSGELGSAARSAEVIDRAGAVHRRSRDELTFRESPAESDDPVILTITFELEPDDADAIVRRMRKAWITRQGKHPLGHEPAVRAFKDPRGQSAAELVERAGAGDAKVGGAEVSSRNANYVLAKPGATARDVLRLIEMVQARVREATGVALEREVRVW